jgi:hypothetical protein
MLKQRSFVITLLSQQLKSGTDSLKVEILGPIH